MQKEHEKGIVSLISQGFDRQVIAQSFAMTLEQIQAIEDKYNNS